MAIAESQITERLMRMGNEARYMKATQKALDLNELRKLAVKQLTEEAEKRAQFAAKRYKDWVDKVKNSSNFEMHYIFVFRDDGLTLEQYVGKLVLDVIKQYKIRDINSTIPSFTA